MNPRVIAVVCCVLALGFVAVKAADYDAVPESFSEKQSDETTEKDLSASNDEAKPETAVAEDENTKTTGLVQNDNGDTVALKNKGLCHYGVAVYYKPGFSIRCSCLKCTCLRGGNWACGYNFAYCPYYYCGNKIYNPKTQICCCGKAYTKKRYHSCCGYNYYNRRTSKCCQYYSVKPTRSACPRSKI